MQSCRRCGRCRPDSQTDCDCGARPSRWSIYDAASLLFGAVVELFILFVMSDLGNAELAAGALFIFMVLCVAAASVVNLGLAAMSYQRRHGWGWQLSVAGVAAWFVTIARMRR